MRIETRWSKWSWLVAGALIVALAPVIGRSHGDVNPQAVDTTGLAPIGEAWLKTNPYRKNATAIKIGESAYNAQCARCHGAGGVSGGMAPDLRSLPLGDEGDAAFLPPTRNGVRRNERTLMPKYEGIVSQEAMWAMRSWLETVHVD
jgi:cytochrome c-550 PedF